MKTSASRGSLEGLLLCRHLCDEMVVDEEASKPARLVRSVCLFVLLWKLYRPRPHYRESK